MANMSPSDDSTNQNPEGHEPHLLKRWLLLDCWTCEQAKLLLSGSEPHGTLHGIVPNYDGFTRADHAEGYACFLDGRADDDHPRREQSIEDLMAVLLFTENIDADERRSPAEWLELAKRNGFTPHWLPWAHKNGLIEPDPNQVRSEPASSNAAMTIEEKVMHAIRELGIDPLRFPSGRRGTRGARADVIKKAGLDKVSGNKAFDRLRDKLQIVFA
ncbi:hypothetical protein PQR34_30000 [Paraburkholderia sediminicola]|uniref:hypothetical protein n=1 Tax=Paraburkholderia sediminicola TaxID=458836 RepID=UPI0038B991AD